MSDPSNGQGSRGIVAKALAFARAIGLLPPAAPPAHWLPCPHCGEETNHALRRCGHCNDVLTPQSKWDTAQAPLEPQRWRD